MTKNRIKEIIVYVIIITVLVVVFLLINIKISQSRSETIIPLDDQNTYVYQFENIKIMDNTLEVNGWFFEVEKYQNIERKIADKNLGIILYDIENDAKLEKAKEEKQQYTLKGVTSKVENIVREDINQYFKCEYDYSKCGFRAVFDLDKLDLDNTCYQLFIKVDLSKEEAIRTNTYLYNNKLWYIDPTTFDSPDLSGTVLETITNYGKCLAYKKDFGIYIYQHDNKLYYIVDKQYQFNEDKKTYIEYQLQTTQFEKLPKWRIENDNFWDNAGWVFENQEIIEGDGCGKYRIAVIDLKKEYSITRILTGCYQNDKWVWYQFLRPIYRDFID